MAGTPGDPILDPDLTREFERLKIVLHPASLDDITKVWSAVSGTNFRRSIIYEVTVVQIETPAPRVRPQPVEIRRIFVTVRRRPEIVDAYVSPAAPGDPIGETRARIGEEITVISEGALADRLYVRFGSLEPIRVSPPGDGRVRIIVPDAQYPADLDHPLPRPIPPGTAIAGRTSGDPAHRHASGGGGRGRAWTGNRDRRVAALSFKHLADAAQSARHRRYSSRRKCRDDPARRRQPVVACRRAHGRSDSGRCGDPGACARAWATPGPLRRRWLWKCR